MCRLSMNGFVVSVWLNRGDFLAESDFKKVLELQRIRRASFDSHVCSLTNKIVRHTLDNIVLCSGCPRYLDTGRVWCKRVSE